MRTTGEIFARVPSRLSDTKIKEFIESHKDWIIQKVSKMSEKKDGRQEIGIPSWENLNLQDTKQSKTKFQSV